MEVRTDVMYVRIYACLSVCMHGVYVWYYVAMYIYRLLSVSLCNRASGIPTKSAKAKGAEFESEGDLAGYFEPLSRLVLHPCPDSGKG